jgi:hypothetical protein
LDYPSIEDGLCGSCEARPTNLEIWGKASVGSVVLVLGCAEFSFTLSFVTAGGGRGAAESSGSSTIVKVGGD